MLTKNDSGDAVDDPYLVALASSDGAIRVCVGCLHGH